MQMFLQGRYVSFKNNLVFMLYKYHMNTEFIRTHEHQLFKKIQLIGLMVLLKSYENDTSLIIGPNF